MSTKRLQVQGLWKKERKRSPYRRRREPKEQFGELVQIDGSIHDWLGLLKKDCLLNMVDDATTTTSAILDSGETTRVVFLSIKRWIERYGIPLSLYVDLKTVYVSPKDKGFSHVQIACKKLGIRIIKARSAQAKGRVERNHAVYQDRFVKELCLNHIQTITEANTVLDSGFVDNLNHKFAKLPSNPESAHRPLGNIDLNQILCWEYERQVQHDWTFSFTHKCYQIEKQYGSCVKPKSNIKVRKHLDDSFSVWYKEEKLSVKEIPKRSRLPKVPDIQSNPSVVVQKVANKSSWYKSNALLYLPEGSTHPKTTLRKRAI